MGTGMAKRRCMLGMEARQPYSPEDVSFQHVSPLADAPDCVSAVFTAPSFSTAVVCRNSVCRIVPTGILSMPEQVMHSLSLS
jgi:hypothetical protein